MKLRKLTIFIFIIVFTSSVNGNQMNESVKTGLDLIYKNKDIFKNKKIGLIINHTSINSKNVTAYEVFNKTGFCKVTAIFSPEHGFYGSKLSRLVKHEKSPLSNVPIYSLYGKVKKPTTKMLKNIDILVYDIQDTGVRFYTYISTMILAMEAAAENNKQFVVLDRPNMIGGDILQGNLISKKLISFIGKIPVLVRYAMTSGELALMTNNERWLDKGIKVELNIIKMENWERDMWFDDTGLKWTNPSPNIPHLNSAALYPGICLFEGTNISEGRGTNTPFLKIGAPWINSDDLIKELSKYEFKGIKYTKSEFTPVSISKKSINPKYKNQKCNGLEFTVTDQRKIKSYYLSLIILQTIYKMYPDKFKFKKTHFDKLSGNSMIRKYIEKNMVIEFYNKVIKNEVKQFDRIRKKYLLY